MKRIVIAAFIGLILTSAFAQRPSTSNPFPTPIEANRDVISVDFVKFARIPDAGRERAPRLMHMTAEPGTQRMFVSAMRGVLYSINYDGQTVIPYLDINQDDWNKSVMSAGGERGLQSFTFHPQFSQSGTPGYGKFYTYIDTPRSNTDADYVSGGNRHSHDTVLLEWTARVATATTYDGAAPRELFRAAQPFPNHNGGEIAFNPLATASDEDFGLLYIGLADGGSGGDPLGVGQNLETAFGKILRIDPLGSNSDNGQYGIPPTNPFVNINDGSLGEIYAYGVRNPQRFTWDSANGRMLLAEIGQNQVEEITPVISGGNLGWNRWEGSFRSNGGRRISLENPRSEAGLVWPIAEYDHRDRLLQRGVSVTGLTVYRNEAIGQLKNKVIFGDIPSGELFYIDADEQLEGGQDAIRRILLNDEGTDKTLLQLIQEENAAQRWNEASRADLRFGFGPKGEIFILNKRDGIIRLLVADGVTDAQL